MTTIFDNPTQKLLNEAFINCSKSERVSTIVKLKTHDHAQQIATGRNDVLPDIIPLSCILTMNDKNMDFVDMLKTISRDENLLEIFDSQCLIWFNKTDLIDIIRAIINKYFDKKSIVNNISVQIKMSIHSLIDEPVKLLELINNCLKPKDLEKKQFGEVFTPIPFINENMLKDIEQYWKKTYDKNIWNDETLTWFDPASGMGPITLIRP